MSQELMNLIETCVLAPLIVTISSFLIALLRQQTMKLQAKIKDEKIKRLLEIAEGVVAQVVTSVSQTYVDGLKAEGTFDADAQKEALEKSKAAIYKLLSVEATQAIQDNYDDVEEWIETKIEETIRKGK